MGAVACEVRVERALPEALLTEMDALLPDEPIQILGTVPEIWEAQRAMAENIPNLLTAAVGSLAVRPAALAPPRRVRTTRPRGRVD